MFKNFKDYFFKGIAVLLPTILTIWIFVQSYRFIQDNVSAAINRAVVVVLVNGTNSYPNPSEEEIRLYAINQNVDRNELDEAVNQQKYVYGARIEKAEDYWVHGPGQITGFLIALVGVFFFGAFLASFVGKALWRRFEHFLLKTPLLRKVYPYIKQITDFFLTQNKLSFTKVAAVEYPRKGIWSIVLVTGEGLGSVSMKQDREYITVFVPSSPTPFTGYVVMVAKEDVLFLDISIEEALRYTISGGVITPTQHKIYEQNKAEKTEIN